jgi:tRNA A-37 threonylcarbamoyl transferase component Bud32
MPSGLFGNARRRAWQRPGMAHSNRVDTVKDTQRASVRLSYEGKVHKEFRGPGARERFANEVRVLRYLESVGCPFVPRLIEEDPEKLQIVTTSAGARVQHLDESRARELFAELETFGVRHDDPDVRNVTYRQTDGRFCLIDFEFATILHGDQAGGLTQEEVRR